MYDEDDSWWNMLEGVCKNTGDSFENLICTLSKSEMKVMFDTGYGGPCGKPFTAWGEKYVYFPVEYDGSEWVDYVPRNPCDIVTEHAGR